MVEKLKGFGQVNALQMIQHILNSYKAIDKINLGKNAVTIISPYNPAEPLASLVDNL